MSRSEFHDFISSPEDIIEDARNGRMFILVDAEDRENEGDVVIPAQMATPDVINFMAKHARGLVCLALTHERAETAEPADDVARKRHATSNRVHGFDRSERRRHHRHLRARSRAHDFGRDRPDQGPRRHRHAGSRLPAGRAPRRRAGARGAYGSGRRYSRGLPGSIPAGVICEIMNDDGTMARLPDLVKFAQLHGMKVGTIADLIAYRRRHDHFITRSVETEIDSHHGGRFKMMLYINTLEYAEHIALVKGDIAAPGPVLVRMHAVNLLDDLLSVRGGKDDVLARSMELIGKEGRGVIVLIRETRSTYISDLLLRTEPRPEAAPRRLKEYGVGAQILLDLGVRDMILLTNSASQDRSWASKVTACASSERASSARATRG